METEYDSSRIEKAKRGLYSPTGQGLNNRPDAGLSPNDIEIANDWGDTKIVHERSNEEGKSHVGILKVLVIVAALTLLGSGGYLVYQYFDPLANPSEKNIDIIYDVSAGTSPGIPSDIILHITNKNRVPLSYANLTLTYPKGTRAGLTPDQDVRDEKKEFGQIGAGQTVDFATKVIFFGEENADVEIKAALEYRFEGINSIFTKTETRTIRILAAPINLTVDTLKEINAGQPLELKIGASSNTVIPLRDVFIKVEYPPGFTFSESSPKPDFGTNIWRVGTLLPAGKFNLKVRGILSGEDKQEKVFHTSVGVGSDKTERDIDTLYSTILTSLSVMRPFIGIQLSLNGKPAGDVPVAAGKRVNGIVVWQNNLDTKIERAQIEVRLRGTALDRSSIKAENGGFYRSSDDTIVYDERGNDTLSILETGESGNVGFSFQPLPPVSGNQLLVNPTITAEVTVRGSRISESGVPEEINSVMTQTVRVSSDVQFVSRAVYYVGPFTNSGPIPPKVEQETTYTIIWSIVNTSNSVNNVQVRAVLPIYVKWYGSVSPLKENVVYNKNTNEVIWSPGDIPAGTGIGTPPREVAFQLVLFPSLSQVATVPPLLTGTTFMGTDSFSGTAIRQEKNDVTTLLTTDPKTPRDSELVVP